MYRGRICEIGTAAEVLAPPHHPYTQMLLASAVDDEPVTGMAAGDMGGAAHTGCVFAARCPHKLGPVCDTTTPPLRTTSATHAIACHLDTLVDAAVQPVRVHPYPQRAAV
jgi:peptide/nickel transport system ATP-binding protein